MYTMRKGTSQPVTAAASTVTYLMKDNRQQQGYVTYCSTRLITP